MTEIKNIIENNLTPMEVNLLNPLVWAYVGDCVYELYVRTNLVNKSKKNAGLLHKEAIKIVNAKAQAEKLKSIMDKLNEEEQNIVRRTRNTESNSIPKNADVIDYKYATALEGLLGYLYLTKQYDRLKEILKNIFD